MNLDEIIQLDNIARQVGKTTAICKAAKELGATVVCHNSQAAKRVAEEHNVPTVSINETFRGTKGPYLVDTTAMSFLAMECENRIQDLERKNEVLRAEMNELISSNRYLTNENNDLKLKMLQIIKLIRG